MFPINKEFISSEDLRREAASARKSARTLTKRGDLSSARTLIETAEGKEAAADHLDGMREHRPPATTLNPYREVRA